MSWKRAANTRRRRRTRAAAAGLRPDPVCERRARRAGRSTRSAAKAGRCLAGTIHRARVRRLRGPRPGDDGRAAPRVAVLGSRHLHRWRGAVVQPAEPDPGVGARRSAPRAGSCSRSGSGRSPPAADVDFATEISPKPAKAKRQGIVEARRAVPRQPSDSAWPRAAPCSSTSRPTTTRRTAATRRSFNYLTGWNDTPRSAGLEGRPVRRRRRPAS